jgi:hypothetical protein
MKKDTFYGAHTIQKVSSWFYPQMSGYPEKLARYKHASLLLPHCRQPRKKSFMALTPGVNVIKLFFFIVDDEAKKAKVFVPGNHFPV